MLDIAETPLLDNVASKVKGVRTARDIVRPGLVDMPAADAALVLRDCRYEKQKRDLTAAGDLHKRVLAELMRQNRWRDYEKIDFVQVDGRLLIINGYHRLGAQVISGAKIKWIFVVHKCETLEEVGALYHTFDTNVKSRSTEQILNVIDAAELLGVSRTTAKAIYDAVPLLIAGFDFKRASADPLVHRLIDIRMEKVKSLQTAAIFWERATKNAPTHIKRRLATQGALAVALTCFQARPDPAHQFWNGVAVNDGLRIGDPRRTYLASLNNIGAGGSAYTLAIQAAVAWNAWYEGRDLKIIKIVESARFRIAGTHWDR